MTRAHGLNRSLFLLALILVAAALAAGCGGQGDQGAPTDSTQAQGGEGTSQPDVATTPPAGGGASRAPAPRTGTIAAGTEIVAALQQSIATDKNKVGDRISLRTTDPLPIGGGVTVPAGSTINGEVTQVKGPGRLGGGAQLTLRFYELVLTDGTSIPITCDPFRLEGKGDTKETALEIGAGAVAGGVLGGVIGGKDDIAKGAAAGAVIGTGIALATKGDQIVLPVGQKLSVRVTSPASVTVRPSAS